MKKILSLALVCVLMVCVLFALASCSNVSEAYAEKINEAAKEEAYTYQDVMDDLGDEAIDITTDIPVVGRNGFIMAVKGCETQEDIEKLIDEGKGAEGIFITILGGKATYAKYGAITEEDLEKLN